MAVDCFEGWSVVGQSSTGDSTIGTGVVSLSVGSYTFPCNFTSELYLDEVIHDMTSDPAEWDYIWYNDWKYVYNFSISDYVNARIVFPTNFLGKVINGVVSCTFTLNNTDSSGHARFYTESYVPLDLPDDSGNQYTYEIDNTGRWTLNCSYSANGVNASVSASSTANYYTLNIAFDNYYVPIASAGNTTVGILDIPLDFAYYGQYAYGGENSSGYASAAPAPLISCILLDVRPYSNPSTSWRCNISGAHFLLDNDYYTILHAIADQTFLQNEASDIAYLKNLLNTWLDASSSTLVPINFGDFALAIYDYLEGIQLSISDAELSDLSHYLGELVALQEYTYDILDALYNRINEMGLDDIESETIDGLTDDILDQVNYEHRYYGSLISSLQSNLDSVISNAPNFSSLQSPANFYIGCLQTLYSSIGSFAIVVSVVLLGGVLLRIIGRLH